VQQSAAAEQAVPIRLQALTLGAHTAALQFALQQSASIWHAAPAAAHVPVHTISLFALIAHVPRQQSPFCTQRAPSGLHGPGPKSHRSSAPQLTQHPPPHDSPVGLQGAAGSLTHTV
jgi:hypothetical protein